jgi:hypothetical protein
MWLDATPELHTCSSERPKASRPSMDCCAVQPTRPSLRIAQHNEKALQLWVLKWWSNNNNNNNNNNNINKWYPTPFSATYVHGSTYVSARLEPRSLVRPRLSTNSIITSPQRFYFSDFPPLLLLFQIIQYNRCLTCLPHYIYNINVESRTHSSLCPRLNRVRSTNASDSSLCPRLNPLQPLVPLLFSRLSSDSSRDPLKSA